MSRRFALIVPTVLLLTAFGEGGSRRQPHAQGGAWAPIPSMPTARSGAAAVVVGETLYVIGGQHLKSFLDANEAFDTRTQRWTRKAGLGLGRTFTAPSATVINGSIYVVAGNPRGYCTNRAEVYDVRRDRWRTLAAAPRARCHAAVVGLGTRLYVMGGWNTSSTVRYTDVDVYDVAAGRWTPGVPLPGWRGAMAAAAIDQTIYLVGGTTADATLSTSVIALDAKSGRWVPKAPIPTPRGAPATAVRDGRLYVIGGFMLPAGEPVLSRIVESYDPRTNTWREEPSLPEPRAYAAAAAVNDRVYVIGGVKTTDDTGILSSGVALSGR